MKKVLLLFLSVFLFSALNQSFAKDKTKDYYNLDSDHSSAQFKIRHLIGKVNGSFNSVDGKIDFNPEKMDKMKVWGKIDTSSINTGIQKRDNHLKSPDFFDIENAKHPEYKWITFESSKFSDLVTTGEETKGKLAGKITIHGVTKPIVLDVTIHGKPIKDPWGNDRMSVSATGMLNRKDFGLTWNKAIETGGYLVGDDVELSLEIEAAKPSTPVESLKKGDKTVNKGNKKEDKTENSVENKR